MFNILNKRNDDRLSIERAGNQSAFNPFIRQLSCLDIIKSVSVLKLPLNLEALISLPQ